MAHNKAIISLTDQPTAKATYNGEFPHTNNNIDVAEQYCSVDYTAVQLVYNPFSLFISQAQLYSQLQLSLQSYPIALSVTNST